VTVILALVVLGLMGAAGVLLLSWCCPFLDRAERFGYGVPIGMVVATDAILLLADATGSLSRLVVVAGTGLTLVVAFGLAARAGRLEPPPSLGAFARSFVPRDRGTWLALAIVAAFAARWALFWPHAVDVRPDGIYATHVNVWGDYPVHLGNVASFVAGDNFPPTHPRFAGVPFGYHYLVDLTAAALVPFGLSDAGALELHSFVLSVVAAVALFAFARALTKSSLVGALSVFLYCFRIARTHFGDGARAASTVRMRCGVAAAGVPASWPPWSSPRHSRRRLQPATAAPARAASRSG